MIEVLLLCASKLISLVNKGDVSATQKAHNTPSSDLMIEKWLLQAFLFHYKSDYNSGKSDGFSLLRPFSIRSIPSFA